jgi:outer membrane receptor protein involved in Fe transport
MAVVEENHPFNPTAFNSLRFGVNRVAAHNNESLRALIPQAADPSLGVLPGRTAAAVTVAGLSPFGGGLGAAGTYLYHYTSFQLDDDVSLTRRQSSLKLGFALERMRSNILARGIPNGQFVFGSLPSFLTNQPTSFQLGLPESLTSRGLRQTLAAAYVQDDLRLRPNLTVNLGVRYE